MQFNWKKHYIPINIYPLVMYHFWAETMSMDYGNTKYALLTVKQAFSQDKWLEITE